MSSEPNILNRINAVKKEYYEEKPKNLLFKKQQKFDCADLVTKNIDINAILPFIFKVEADTIFFNYSIFKVIASPSVYLTMANYLFSITEQVIGANSSYNLSVDMTGLTMSAIERYRDFVVTVSSEGLKNGKGLLKHLNRVHLHNPPSFVEYLCSIIIPIVDPAIKDRFVIYFKNGNVVKYEGK
jgi:hypothetical protein